MNDKKPTLKVDIQLPSEESTSASTEAKKPPIITKPDRQVLHRRLRSNGFKFYDMGVMKNSGGDWVDVVFWADPHYIVSDTGVEQDFVRREDLDAKRDFFLDIGVENFEKKFRQITKENADFYQLRIDGSTLVSTSGRWNDDGTSVEATVDNVDNDVLWFGANPFFSFTEFAEGSYVKVTEEPTLESEQVQIDFKGNESFFLAPVFNVVRARLTGNITGTVVSGWNPNASFVNELYSDYQTFPRVALASEVPVLQSKSYAFGIFIPAAFVQQTYWTMFWNVMNFLKSQSFTRNFIRYQGTRTFDVGMGLQTESVQQFTEIAVSDFPKSNIAHLFPPPPGYPLAYTSGMGGAIDVKTSWGFGTRIGDLICVVKQGKKFYYAWHNTNS